MIQNAELLKKVFNFSEYYLENIHPKNVDLGKYLNNQKTFTKLDLVCDSMINSAQNRNMLPGVIQYKERHDAFKKALFEFDHIQILSHFDEESLFSNFQEQFPVKNAKNPRNLWRIFAKSIISICEFLKPFEDAKAFDDFVLTFTKNEITRAALPMVLEKEIYGYGFALACDFLKELGYTQYPKPDDHLMDVFSGVKICERDPYTVYKSTIRMAQACGRTAYYVDKTIWLICSGNYYLDDIEIPGGKKDFIDACKVYLSND
jgi:hypothetical protein